jgi:hypothetical protein
VSVRERFPHGRTGDEGQRRGWCRSVLVCWCSRDTSGMVQLTDPAPFSFWKNPAMASAEETRRSARHSAGGVVVVGRIAWAPAAKFPEVDNGSSDAAALIRQTGQKRQMRYVTPASLRLKLRVLGHRSCAHNRGGTIQVAQSTRDVGAESLAKTCMGRSIVGLSRTGQCSDRTRRGEL